MDVKILGTGCANCRALEEVTRQAVEEVDADASVEKVEEMSQIVGYDVMGLPALVVDGEVVLSGRVPDAGELAELLAPAG